MSANKRLLSVDILRGITIAGMILVNNPGSWGHMYAPLAHAEWNGLTPCDLVFPFFMFIMGGATYFSLKKYNFTISKQSLVKILRRALVLFFIGWAMQWLSHFCYSLSRGESFVEAIALDMASIRYLGVMQRLGICYGVAALVASSVKFSRIPWIAGTLLVVYSLMLIFGNGYDISLDNIIYKIDNAVLTPEHMYHAGAWGALNAEFSLVEGYGSQEMIRAAFDPEGFCSTLPAIAHVLIGFMFGRMLATEKDNLDKMRNLLGVGACMMMAAWLLSYGMPFNKNLWSPTFVLMTCGMASSLLAMLIWLVDVKGYKVWSRFFESFGINPLFMYIMGAVVSILFGTITLPIGDGATIYRLIFVDLWLNLVGEENIYLASCLYAITFVNIIWGIGYALYRNKIIIKI